ncbi:uncharacterized protein LOC6505322 [Drosophila ananassae]|nr:uncharacterized protein LOC6505322 [Drosophila ananassae]
MELTAESPEPLTLRLYLEETLQTFIDIISELARDFDSKMGLVELQRAIDDIDRNMRGYLGAARDRLDQLRTDNTLVYHAYQSCANQMFEWSVSISSTLDTLIPLLTRPNSSPADKTLFWRTIAKALGTGLAKADISLDYLNGLEANALEDHFQAMLRALRNDFALHGVYGKKVRELKSKIAGEEPPSERIRTETLWDHPQVSDEESSEKDTVLEGSDCSAYEKPSSSDPKRKVSGAGCVAEPTPKFENAEKRGIIERCKKIAYSLYSVFFPIQGKPEVCKKIYEDELGKVNTLQLVLTGNIEEAIAILEKFILHLEADKKRFLKLRQLNSRDLNIALLVAHPELRADTFPHLLNLMRVCVSYKELRTSLF